MPVTGRETGGSKEGPNLSELIDGQLISIPALQHLQVPPLAMQYLTKISGKMALSPTAARVLEVLSSPDVKADRVAAVVRTNPYYEHSISRMIAALAKRESVPSLEALIVLYGMSNTRNLVAAIQLVRAVRGAHPEWGPDDKLTVKPVELVKYALLAEAGSMSVKDGAGEAAFYAGLAFDHLAQTAEMVAADKKKAAAYLEVLFKHSLRTGQLVSELVKGISGFKYSRLAFGAGLLHDIGKGALAILDASYPKFAEDCVKKEMPRSMRFFAETQRFGVHHAELGVWICRGFPMLRPIAEAIAHHHGPYVLKSREKDLYQLAGVICLATTITDHFKVVNEPSDPAFEEWRTRELKDFMLKPQDIIAALRAVAKKA